MNTVTIPKSEYETLRKTIEELQAKLKVLVEFEQMLPWLKKYFVEQASSAPANGKVEKPLEFMEIERTGEPIPWKFGAGKHLIKYMADDFTAPMEDFKDYM